MKNKKKTQVYVYLSSYEQFAVFYYNKLRRSKTGNIQKHKKLSDDEIIKLYNNNLIFKNKVHEEYEIKKKIDFERSSNRGKKNIEIGTFGTTELSLKGVKSQKESGKSLFLSPEMSHYRTIGARNSVKTQMERGSWEIDFRSKGTEAGNKQITCTYCGFKSSLRNIKGKHNEKCKQKPEDMQKVLSTLPGIFTPGQWQKALIDNGFNYTSKTAYVILHHGIYTYKIENKIYCKIGYVPSKNEIKNLKGTNGKATAEKIEKINKIKSILVGEFKGPDIDKVCLELGFTIPFGRSLLRSSCIQVYKGIPGSKTNTSIYSFK